MKTYALYHLKGGVGKTSSSVNLAFLSAKEGHKTLLWDIDPQGGSSFILERKTDKKADLTDLLIGESDWKEAIKKTDYKNLFVLPSDHRNRNLDVDLNEMKRSKKRFNSFLSLLKREFEYVFIDCPPSLGLSAENVFRAADFILIPIIPSQLSEHSYQQVLHFFEENNYDKRKLIPFFTLVDHRRKVHNEHIKAFRKSKRRIMNTIIPYSATIEKMSTNKAPIHDFSARSKAAKSYRNLWQELKWFRKLKKR